MNFDLNELMEREEGSFSINNDELADWALQKIFEEYEECDRLIVLAQKKIEELQSKIDKLKEEKNRKTSYLKGKLAEYFETVPSKATKTQKSYKLLSGSLIFKMPKETMKTDDEKLLQYFRNNNMFEFINVEETPKWGEFKKQLSIIDGEVVNTETGEIIDIITVEESPGTFDVKIG